MKRLRLGNKKGYKIDLRVLGPLSLQLAVKNGKGCQGQFFSSFSAVSSDDRYGWREEGGGEAMPDPPRGFYFALAPMSLCAEWYY